MQTRSGTASKFISTRHALARTTLLLSLCAASVTFDLPNNAQAENKPQPFTLESPAGDIIQLQKGKIPTKLLPVAPLTNSGEVNAPALENKPAPDPDTIRSSIDKDVAGRLVTVCLANTTSGSSRKAFDVQRKLPPRFAAKPGKQICARFEPSRHKIYFWKENKTGKLVLTLASPLDLTDADGTLFRFSWVQDK